LSEGDQEKPSEAVEPKSAAADSPAAPTPDGSEKPPITGSEGSSARGVPEAQVAAPVAASESDWLGSVQSLLVTVVIAIFVITFIVQAFQIPSESMENTLLIGDYLLVDKAHYGPSGMWKWALPYRSVKRGDIIVFRYPIHPSQHFVKRVIGIPGDRVRMVHGRVFVDRQPMSEPYAVHKFRNTDDYRDNFPTGQYLSPSVEAKWYLQMRKLIEDGELIVPADSYFVLGDNRDDSLDSRYWGFVPRENIIGTPLLIYWSMARPEFDDDEPGQDGKLTRFGHLVANVFQNMRWKRMMRLVH
jgi:signal peptidase I